jgi:hypothetical protein
VGPNESLMDFALVASSTDTIVAEIDFVLNSWGTSVTPRHELGPEIPRRDAINERAAAIG